MNTLVPAAMSQLLGLLGSYADVLDWIGGDVEIDGITPASQRVLPGYMCVALGGNSEEGGRWIPQVLQQGAVAVLAEWAPEDLSETLPWGTFTYVRVFNARSAWFWLCRNCASLCKLGTVPVR
jgi:UDP-N-acetylmuramyl tripeptide synthase